MGSQDGASPSTAASLKMNKIWQAHTAMFHCCCDATSDNISEPRQEREGLSLYFLWDIETVIYEIAEQDDSEVFT